MKAFATLLDRLGTQSARNGKLALLEQYFRSTPDPDRGWALAALTDGLTLRLPVPRTLADLMAARIDPELYRLSRDYVGDTAETVALLWPDGASAAAPPTLSDVMETLFATHPSALAGPLTRWLDSLDASGRYALLKLLTGALRVGVSARLAKTALARLGPISLDAIEEAWHGLSPPYADLFAWVEGRGPRPEIAARATFRPMMLAHPLEDADFDRLAPADFLAEWKWDGIRVQLVSEAGEMRLFSRTGDDVSASFPECLVRLPVRAVLDGELLVVRDGQVAPFNDLQQRLGRKAPAPAMLKRYPAHIRLYDLLVLGDQDLRGQAFQARRAALEAFWHTHRPARTDLSDLVAFEDFESLSQIWASTRAEGIEGLMLKARLSPYLAGRPKGHWFKWKRSPLTVDTVLMYAQRGSGKRSSYYSDYTFGAWRVGADGAAELVPVGKAYSGFTDEELKALDRWIRNNTIGRFGPVRQVAPGLVLEVAFDAIHRSARHKSGVAMRFPRIARIRWDKPASEADTLTNLEALMAG